MKLQRKVEKSRLYNASDAIEERMLYSLPGGHDAHCVAHYAVHAPAKDFFFIPEMIEIDNGMGDKVPIFPRFTETLLREDRWGGRGVVLVDPEFEEKDRETPDDRTPVAANDKAAIAKANRILETYERAIIAAFVAQCAEAQAKGMPPVGAKGYTKKLLDKYGVVDPSVPKLIAGTQTANEIEQLRKQMAEQQETFNRQLAELAAKLSGGGKAQARGPASGG